MTSKSSDIVFAMSYSKKKCFRHVVVLVGFFSLSFSLKES